MKARLETYEGSRGGCTEQEDLLVLLEGEELDGTFCISIVARAPTSALDGTAFSR